MSGKVQTKIQQTWSKRGKSNKEYGTNRENKHKWEKMLRDNRLSERFSIYSVQVHWFQKRITYHSKYTHRNLLIKWRKINKQQKVPCMSTDCLIKLIILKQTFSKMNHCVHQTLLERTYLSWVSSEKEAVNEEGKTAAEVLRLGKTEERRVDGL